MIEFDKVQVISTLVATAIIAHVFEPVSYTHLDVYKRQTVYIY